MPVTVVVISILLTTVALCLLVVIFFRLRLRRHRRLLSRTPSSGPGPSAGTGRRPSIGFLHPHALSGGGGERVLWSFVFAIHRNFPDVDLVIYSIWDSDSKSDSDRPTSNESIWKTAARQFGVDLKGINFERVDISDISYLAEAGSFPRLTLLLQGLGSVLLGIRAFRRRPVDIYVDTANLAFALVGPTLLCNERVTTVSYTHYPTISADMLGVVARRQVGVHNDAGTAGSEWKTWLKLGYYRMFAVLYGMAGRFCVDFPIANSSWTAKHLHAVWGRRVPVVYPPCFVTGEEDNNKNTVKKEEKMIISVGQFRPEKRHLEQVCVMAKLIKSLPSEKGIKLVMVGGARHESDVARAHAVQAAVDEAGLGAHVELRMNVSREELKELLQRAGIGLHTMRYEHFGIGVVELMANDVVVVAHRSGGVEADLVAHGRTGFLAEDEDGFVSALQQGLHLGLDEKQRVRRDAKAACSRFSEKAFEESVVRELSRCALLTKTRTL